MTRKALIWVLLAGWALAYAASVAAFLSLESAGDGFTRGLNRLMAFFGWQIVAGAFASAVWLAGRNQDHAPLRRWLVRLPALMAGLLVILVIVIIALARLSHPDPAPPPPTRITLPPVSG